MSRTRVLIGILGMDQHEVAAVGISKMIRDQGMEVIYTGCFNTPETIVQAALEEDVDIIGISSHSWEYLYYMPELMALLAGKNLDIPVIIGGSVITRKDAEELKGMGVAAVFGSGSRDVDMLKAISELTGEESGTPDN